MDILDQYKLELESDSELQKLITRICNLDFPKEGSLDLRKFIENVTSKQSLIKDFVLSNLADKVSNSGNYINSLYENSSYVFRNLINVVISTNDDEAISVLETYLAKQANLNKFFIFIEEMINKNKDISSCENTFYSLLIGRGVIYSEIELFLSTIKKDRIYFVKKLIEKRLYFILQIYVEELCLKDVNFLIQSIVPIIIEELDSIYTYLSITTSILYLNESATFDLLNNSKHDQLFKAFENRLLTLSDEQIVIKYVNLLASYYPHLIESFEQKYIKIALPNDLVEYAINNKRCNRRFILSELIKRKNDEALSLFIKSFPEFHVLLPLL
jgi:hypothetical protein